MTIRTETTPGPDLVHVEGVKNGSSFHQLRHTRCGGEQETNDLTGIQTHQEAARKNGRFALFLGFRLSSF